MRDQRDVCVDANHFSGSLRFTDLQEKSSSEDACVEFMSSVMPPCGAIFNGLNRTLCVAEPAEAEVYLRGGPVEVRKREFETEGAYVGLE